MCAYLHCHGKLPNGQMCGWQQDDFWSLRSGPMAEREGYTPLRSDIIEYLREILFKDVIYMDHEYFLEHLDLPSYLDQDDSPCCKATDYVAHDLRHRADRIANMSVKTEDDWRQVKENWKCPRCGSDEWDVD